MRSCDQLLQRGLRFRFQRGVEHAQARQNELGLGFFPWHGTCLGRGHVYGERLVRQGKNTCALAFGGVGIAIGGWDRAEVEGVG